MLSYFFKAYIKSTFFSTFIIIIFYSILFCCNSYNFFKRRNYIVLTYFSSVYNYLAKLQSSCCFNYNIISDIYIIFIWVEVIYLTCLFKSNSHNRNHSLYLVTKTITKRNHAPFSILLIFMNLPPINFIKSSH